MNSPMNNGVMKIDHDLISFLSIYSVDDVVDGKESYP